MNEELIYEQVGKYVTGEALPQEAMLIEDWASESKENESYLLNAFKIFNIEVPDTKNEDRVWKNIEAEIIRPKLVPARKSGKWTIGIAASMLILVTTALLINNRKANRNAKTIYEAITAAKEIKLEDGTVIILDAHSSATIYGNYGDSSRDVSLEGSASFYVLHDPAKPFTVTTGKLHIRDIGTRFSLTQSPDSTNIVIAVQEGMIYVFTDEGNSINLLAGEEAVYHRSSGNLAMPKSIPSSLNKMGDTSKSYPNKHQTDISKNDTVQNNVLPGKDPAINFSVEEAQDILRGPVSMTSNNTNKNDGLVKYSRQFTLRADASVNLYTDVEYFATTEAAHQVYERSRPKDLPVQTDKDLINIGADAFVQTDSINYYLIVLQKQQTVFRIRIAKPRPGINSKTLAEILKRKLQSIK
jgi:transmembrane sensor